MKRIVAIQFPQLMSERISRRRPELKEIPFAMAMKERGRRVIKAVNSLAYKKDIHVEMVVADCKAILPGLEVLEYDPEEPKKVLYALAEWFIRFAPVVCVDLPDGLLLDVSGCTHLWGGEEKYIRDIAIRLKNFGYTIRIAVADTAGTAWALSRFGKNGTIVPSGKEAEFLSGLSGAALRIDPLITARLEKLGLLNIGSFMDMPPTALRRRFGQQLLTRLGQALGKELELMEPVRPVSPYEERLPSIEPICTATGIGIALNNLLEMLCVRLNRESKGLRKCELICYRIDGLTQKINIGTSKPSRNVTHLFKLFSEKISKIDPGLGIELFILEANPVEELLDSQDALWAVGNATCASVAELVDRLAGRTGANAIHRYLPAEHYWPERSMTKTASLSEKATTAWRNDLPRPLHLLKSPEPIEVSVPVPDYPPMLFRHKGVIHNVKRADGPERIEQEWWIQGGLYRDYYCVEDEQGARYWLFRSGDYKSGKPKWFVHGFFP
ncbi:MAG: Y-family DNA polymerase [Bacteroidia bacterium]